ncbi:Arm DNA-binding domain-containing protein [Paraburkholderia sprentiae WSM5005]|uniref:Arm DNA-binding domain-containing protein n=1 Tax=Paraburkholderia sprentiae WSM5005 TaxID=754502 RepID=A0A1I9YI78_9BURK|nr:Arm DNA-binding domain-containing protein [Paraburkholderia sprentiae]APA86011.1 Arm DNA-binding domain-containing protein [Paraburkholderia sprentiae WSM5005]
MALTDIAMRRANGPKSRQSCLTAGALCLLVTSDQGKYSRRKYRLGGEEKSPSSGAYQQVTLAAVRNVRIEARASFAAGVAGEVRKEQRAARQNEAGRVKVSMRVSVDSEGELSIRPGTRRMNLNPSETVQPRAFLDAARNVSHRIGKHGTD